jgi:hypothetical protein
MMSVEERFLYDPVFRNIVSAMEKMIETYQFTPTEAREAVMLACVRVEERKAPVWRMGAK